MCGRLQRILCHGSRKVLKVLAEGGKDSTFKLESPVSMFGMNESFDQINKS